MKMETIVTSFSDWSPEIYIYIRMRRQEPKTVWILHAYMQVVEQMSIDE